MIIGATTTQFTSVANPAGPHMIGNLIAVTSGTGFTVQWVEVTAFTLSGLLATCDKSLGTTASTGGNGGLGGALASPGKAAGLKVTLNTIFIIAGTYGISGSSNVAGGVINDSNQGFWIGYNTTRTTTNADATIPLLNCNGAGLVTFQVAGGGSPTIVANIELNAVGHTTSWGFYMGGGCKILRCKSSGFLNNFFTGGQAMFVDCYASGGTNGYNFGSTANYTIGCIANGCVTGFGLGGGHGCVADNCIAYGCSSIGFDIQGSIGNLVKNCSAYNNTTVNFQISAGSGSFINCVAYTSATNYKVTPANDYSVLFNCAGGGFSSAQVTIPADANSGSTLNIGFITLTANPFNTVSTDFGLNATAGGGALCRQAGIPGTFIGLTTTIGYPDIGGVQSAAPVNVNTGGFTRILTQM